MASRTSASQTGKKQAGSNSPISFPNRHVNNVMDKKLSKLFFKDKGVRVGVGSIKHLLKRDNLVLHHQLFTSEEILEKNDIGGSAHLDLAEGVSSLFLNSLFG